MCIRDRKCTLLKYTFIFIIIIKKIIYHTKKAYDSIELSKQWLVLLKIVSMLHMLDCGSAMYQRYYMMNVQSPGTATRLCYSGHFI